MLEWTGERYLPWIEDASIGYEHLHRYAYAAQFVANKKVLDLASGEGYGSRLLAQTAESVVGVDIDEQAIRHARNKYIKSNLKFEKGSITDVPIPGQNIFDVIVCFEAIEHIDEHEKLLKEVKRLLTTDGLFLVSTPNKRAYSDEPKYENPFHVHELYFDEFTELMGRYFTQVKILGQRIYCNSNIWPVFSNRHSKLVEHLVERNLKEFAFVDADRRIPLYFIALASEAKVDENASNLVDISNELLRQKDLALANFLGPRDSLEGTARNQRRALTEKDQRLRALTEEQERLTQEVARLRHTAQSQQQHLTQTEEERYRLSQENSLVNAVLQAREEYLRTIEDSLAWALLTKYRRVRDTLCPDGTGRRQTYNAIKNSVKKVVSGLMLTPEPKHERRLRRNARVGKLTAIVRAFFGRPVWARHPNQIPLAVSLASSGLFEPVWYFQKNKDVAESGMSAIFHYLLHGAKEGRDPNPYFDTSWYLAQNPDVASAGINPLAHYLRHGAQEGRDPSLLFDTSFYLEQNPDVATAGINPLVHYLRHGIVEGRRPTAQAQQGVSGFQQSAQVLRGTPALPQENYESRYEELCRRYQTVTREERALISRLLQSATRQPLISIILVLNGTSELTARIAFDSVRSQIYNHWELFAAYTFEANSRVSRELDEWSNADSRVKPFAVRSGCGMEEIYRDVLKHCRGEYVLFLRNPARQSLFEWLLALFVLRSVHKNLPSPFPIELETDLYEFLISEQFPINESDLGRALREISPNENDPAVDSRLVCKEIVPPSDTLPVTQNLDVKAIAFYLPQFHRIAENDSWWGDGFTEWTHVKRARGLFRGHDQPRVPSDLGYYDLGDAETRQKQAELAQRYGIYGFCYYHYRFAGKPLLEMPFNEVLSSGRPSLPFCLCWANENWTRRWDGLDQQILIAQEYSLENDKAFIEELIPAFGDSRYIKINGRPLLIVYRPGDIPDLTRTCTTWRQIVKASGFPDLYLAGVHSFGWFEDPREHGMDAAIEFPVHFWVQGPNKMSEEMGELDSRFNGGIKSYYLFRECSNSRQKPRYTLFKGAMPTWDNTARRMERATIFHTNNLVPESYYDWLRRAVDYTRENLIGDERLIFINAWNEWGEGCYLEPDKTHGHALLRANRLALSRKESAARPGYDATHEIANKMGDLEIVFVSHDAFRSGAQRLLLTLIRWLSQTAGIRPKIILRRGGVLEAEFMRLGPVLQLDTVADSELSTAVRRFIGESASLVYVNTLVPGDIAEIVAGLGVPMITHVHELENAIQRWCDKDLLRRILTVTDHFIAASQPVAHNLISQHGIEDVQITVMNEFIECSYQDLELVDKPALRRKLHLTEREFIVFGCGTTDWRKGPDLFVDVAHAFRGMGPEDMHFYWIGSGTAEEIRLLQRKIDAYGLNNHVTLLGEVIEPKTYFQAGDVFVLASREDPFPLACLEAADCGLPILCFENAGGMPDFVDSDAGFVVPFENTERMAERLHFLYANPRAKDRLGLRACEKVRSENDVSVAGPRVLETVMRVARSRSNAKGDLNIAASPVPKVSVIVPNYNHSRFLRQRLDSVLSQTFVDYEVLVLDDASTDNSREIMNSYRSDPRFRFIFNERNSGSAVKQWQKGVGEARGEYIWFAESDDYAAPEFLNRLVSVLDVNPSVGMAYCRSNVIDRENAILGESSRWTDDLDTLRWKKDFLNDGRAEIREFLSKKNTIPNASAVLLRSSVLTSIGRIDGSFRLCGDWFLWVQVLLRSNIAYVAEHLNYWRQASSNSRIGSPGVLEWEEGQRVLRYLSGQLELSDSETKNVLSAFRDRCWSWLKDGSATPLVGTSPGQRDNVSSRKGVASGLRDVLSELEDHEWLDLLITSIHEPRYRGFTLPGFPAEALQRQFGGSNGEATIREAFNFYRAVKDSTRLHFPLRPSSRVLDFGCGWGRITRCFLREISSENLFGIDVDPTVISVCRETFLQDNFHVIDARPPTMFEPASFDCIYAYSVFSHLAETVHIRWVQEFARILKPGGILVVTTQGRSFIEFCRSLREREEYDHPWHQALARSFVDTEGALANYDAGLFLYSATGGGDFRPSDVYGEAIIPRAYVEREWTKFLVFRDFIDDRAFLPQAFIVMQKRA